MYIAQRGLKVVLAGLKSYGPASLKRYLWEREYSADKWKFAENSIGDCVYPVLEKYARNGSILDLGCGSGNTGNELSANAYRSYLGVDISETCLNKARARSKANGRADKNTFVSGDFLSFAPNEHFDVILFRESMYHVPIPKIPSTIAHYSKYLRDGGVFVVRMATADADGTPKARPTAMMEVLKREFDIVECSHDKGSGGTVIVFRSQKSRGPVPEKQ